MFTIKQQKNKNKLNVVKLKERKKKNKQIYLP